MNDSVLPWVVVVAAEGPATDDERRLLASAKSLTAVSKACCILDEDARRSRPDLTRDLWQSNVFSRLAAEPIIRAVQDCLQVLQTQDAAADVILIPANHCAVDQASWLACARNALQMGHDNAETVYLLHDKAENDPRVALQKPELCSTSVMIGSVGALLDLCRGKRPTTIVDLVADESTVDAVQTPYGNAADDPAESPINVVHIRSVAEYARLQRGDYGKIPASRVDLRV